MFLKAYILVFITVLATQASAMNCTGRLGGNLYSVPQSHTLAEEMALAAIKELNDYDKQESVS